MPWKPQSRWSNDPRWSFTTYRKFFPSKFKTVLKSVISTGLYLKDKNNTKKLNRSHISGTIDIVTVFK